MYQDLLTNEEMNCTSLWDDNIISILLRLSKYFISGKTGDLLKEVQFIKKKSMTGQEKDDLLIQVTA
jgi:hypothetical protein